MWENLKSTWREGGMLTRLVWVNAAVFLLLLTLDVLDRFGGGAVSGVLPAAGARTLATSWQVDILAQRPWSVVTHMFTHQDLWHIAMNMLLLFWMGRVYHGEVGSRRLLSTYLAGGLAGFVAYFLVTNGFKPLQGSTYALGASASVMAIFGALATLRPEMKFNLILFGPVALKHLFWGYVVLDYFGLSQGVNAGGNLAHLGGALFGVLLVRQDRQGRNLVGWLEWVLDALSSRSFSVPRRKRSRFKASTSNRWKASERESSRAPMSDDEFNAERAAREDRLDAILDKISKHGYDHLSPEEKRFLFDQSQR
jgi:membrane associated rhomboid family serine protease